MSSASSMHQLLALDDSEGDGCNEIRRQTFIRFLGWIGPESIIFEKTIRHIQEHTSLVSLSVLH